jgi:RNA recognition motif-containing protein
MVETKKIYVGNLSETTTCEELVRHFKEFLDDDDDNKNVCACDLMTDRNTGASRGYAFMTLTKENAERLLSERTVPMILDGHELILGENFSRGLRRPIRPLSIVGGGTFQDL